MLKMQLFPMRVVGRGCWSGGTVLFITSGMDESGPKIHCYGLDDEFSLTMKLKANLKRSTNNSDSSIETEKDK